VAREGRRMVGPLRASNKIPVHTSQVFGGDPDWVIRLRMDRIRNSNRLM